jgi:acetylornithine deacetylase/succinyl-diaminopimelate desuccinylase-like protein
MLPKAVTDYLESHRQEQLEQLFELLRFPSVSSQGEHEADCLACAERVAEHLRGLGFAAELRPWRRHPVLIARRQAARAGARTVLLYGHYDVQPPEPLEQWQSPAFEPTIRDEAIYARGASDDKGQLFAHVKAVEALLQASGELPLNLTFFLEGEEEIGSPELERFVTDNAADLRADYAVVSDSEFFARGLPSITYGLRGLAYVELTLSGPSQDLHSGVHGGAVVNPLNALAGMVAAMHDPTGRVTLPGFYDDVLPLTEAERRAWEALPFDEAEYAAGLGTAPAGGERGLGVLERRWGRPTLDCNGIVGGYQGEGAKTVIPASATAKISMRLVPDQRPERIVEGFRRFVAEHTPEGVKAGVTVSAQARPVLVATGSPAMSAAKAALAEAFGGDVAMVRNGASVPITELIQRVLKLEPILMGFGLPDDNLHAPNEHFRLEQFHGAIAASAAMLNNLAQIG